jgi:hypothetical protein
MPDRSPRCLPHVPILRLAAYRSDYPNRLRPAAAASFLESRANLQLQEPDCIVSCKSTEPTPYSWTEVMYGQLPDYGDVSGRPAASILFRASRMTPQLHMSP